MPRKSDSLSTEVRMGKKICFISLDSYPLLARNNTEVVGGAEVQQVILAKELLKHGFKVTFVTYNDEPAPVKYIDDIEVIKACKRMPRSNLNLFPKAWYIWKAMGKADADIYFHRAGASGLVVAIFCYLRRKRFVHYIPSDSNVSKKDMLMNYKFYHRLGIKLDIKLADVVIAQNEFQKKMLKENFGRESLIIKNAFLLPSQKIPEKADPPIVLWVATIRNAKQPELFLKLAEAITEARFQMIGGVGDSVELYQRIKESAARTPNLEFMGFIPFHEIAEYFRQASILVNTSGVEGFSNTFIQAWQQYTPVVSLHSDPDEIICKYKLGFHSKTSQQLKEDVRTLLKDKQLREEMGRNGRQYVEKEHDITKVVPRYLEVFKHLLKNTKVRL